MTWIIKRKWFVPVIWAALALALFFIAPDLNELVREKGQLTLPDDQPSMQAERILQEVREKEGRADELNIALVIRIPDGVNSESRDRIKSALEELEANGQPLGVTSVISPFSQPELEEQLISEDKSTLLSMLSVEQGERSVADIRQQLTQWLDENWAGTGIEYEMTGAELIDEDVIISSEEGLKKTELITFLFILIVLLAVFRSFVAPLVPLITVGVSYFVARFVVAILADTVHFPLSTFTQVFMVAVMFGIGTDYCILLLSRFKEELAKRESIHDAVVSTYRTAGKTVFFSGLAVLVGFTAIGLSRFILYRSAVAVAVGIAVMMFALVTIVPFLMALLGPKLFWPLKGAIEHKPSRLWEAAGRFAVRRPLAALLITAAVVTPVLIQYDGKVSFNSLDEIGAQYGSVKGFNIIADQFGPGEALPTEVVLYSERRWDTPEGLAVLEAISREIETVKDVEYVRSAVRPLGEPLEQFLISEQAEMLEEGLLQSEEGLGQIRAGLEEAATRLEASAPELEQAAEAASELARGSGQLRQGVQQLNEALTRLEQGLREGSMGARELAAGANELRTGAEQLLNSSSELESGYSGIAGGLKTIIDQYRMLENQLAGLPDALDAVYAGLEQALSRHPQLGEDRDFLVAMATVSELRAGAHEMVAGLQQLNEKLAEIESGLRTANAGYAQARAGLKEFSFALSELADGLAKLQSGIEEAAEGQRRITHELPGLIEGAGEMNTALEAVAQGMANMRSQLAQLTDGLGQSADGLGQIADGLKQMREYAGELADAPSSPLGGWHLPDEALQDETFVRVLENFMSDDRHVTTLQVIFAANPYVETVLDRVDDVREAVAQALQGTAYADAEFGVGGVSSVYADLRQVSGQDYVRTAVWMIIGIVLILIVLLRSLVMPIYLLASLILTYFVSLGVAEWIFVDMFGYSGVSWAVPFFGFVMLLALGVDYSIFLMSRFNEYRNEPAAESIVEAMKHMGTVIMSAAIILGGTFAAMYPAQVLSLLQIATIVICGLALYSLVMLPLFVPAMVKWFGQANWWPFSMEEKKDA